MQKLWSPDDALGNLLLHVGVPTGIVAIILSILAVISWRELYEAASGYGRTAAKNLRNSRAYGATERLRTLLSLLLCVGVFLMMSYCIAQLASLNYSIFIRADGVGKSNTVPWQVIVRQTRAYDRWDVVSQWTIIGSSISVVLLGFAYLAGIRFLEVMVKLPWMIITAACFVIAAFVGLGEFVGLLFFLFDREENEVEGWWLIMYVIDIVVLVGLPFLAQAVDDLSLEMYGARSAGRTNEIA